MAMMITRFHKLIQSKTVWYIILGVIVISFVGFFTPTMRSGGKHPKENYAGELFDRKVTNEEYRRAYSNAYVWQILSEGRMIQVNEDVAAALHQEAWVRLAALHKAQEEEIDVSNDEVVRQIRMMPVFNGQSGAFDPAVYKAILQNLNLSASQVEELFREQLTLSKLLYRYTQAALIAPEELARAYHLYTDRFVLDYAVLTRASVEKDVTVSAEEAETFYTQHQESFRMPEKVRVSCVEFPVADYLDQVEIPEGAALQVYNRNLEQYRVETTNDAGTVEYKPFEEVEAEITAQIRKTMARRIAAGKAAEFVADVAPASEDETPDFKGKAAAAGLAVKAVPPVSADEPPVGIDPTAPFGRAAFGLQPDSYSSFSDAVVGQDTVYVLSLEQRYESFIPTFDIVKDKAEKEALRQAVNTALADKALEVQKAAVEALASGKLFSEAVKPFGLTITTTPEFDLTSNLDDPYASTLIPLCLNVEEGGVCEPTPVADGVLIASVASRKSTDIEVGLPAVREELISGLERNRSQQLAAMWRADLLSPENFKDWTSTPSR
ncbi:MAG: SurA N-terminal domain-containing protein [Kiritimatiellales bacterium]